MVFQRGSNQSVTWQSRGLNVHVLAGTDVAQLADADLPCAGGHHTAIEVNTGFQNLVRRINSSVDAPSIDDPAGIPVSTSDELRKHVNDVIRSINDTTK